MNCIHDIREILLKLYILAVRKYPLTTSEENSIYESEYLSDEQISRIEYICRLIDLFDEEDKDSFIRLIVLYYYTINYSYTLEFNDENDLDEEDTLMSLVENSDESDIVFSVLEGEIVNLFDIVNFIIEEDIINYEELDKTSIDDFDEYQHLDYIIKSGSDISDIYNKLHPSINVEEERYNSYLKHENIEKKFTNIEVKNAFGFAHMFSMIKQNIKSRTYQEDMLTGFLHNIKDNKELSSSINIYMLKYSYLKRNLEKNENKDSLKLEISKRLVDIYKIDDVTLNDFVDFDLSNFISMMNKLSDEEKEELNDLINIENLSNYGNNGIWKKYDISDYSKICKYTPFWTDSLDSNLDINIYYSNDSKGDYNIPRLCIISDNKKIVTILGRRGKINIEFDLIDILEEKVKEYTFDNSILKDISTLKYIKYLEDKIYSEGILTREEFEYVYGLNNNNSCLIFDKYDLKIEELRSNPYEKNLLANYFNCSIDLVALNKEELNENTEVTKVFFPTVEECYYPNLRVIFGTADCDYLDTAKGLDNLEYIKGDASFSNITSSLGLENLKYVGGNCLFKNLEDTDNLNKDLVIKGEIFFKEGYEPDNFTLIK